MTQDDLLNKGHKFLNKKIDLVPGYGLERMLDQARPLHKMRPFKENGENGWMTDTEGRKVMNEQEWIHPKSTIAKRLVRRCKSCGGAIPYTSRFSLVCDRCANEIKTTSAEIIPPIQSQSVPTFLDQNQIEEKCREMTHVSNLEDIAKVFPSHSVFLPGSVIVNVYVGADEQL